MVSDNPGHQVFLSSSRQSVRREGVITHDECFTGRRLSKNLRTTRLGSMAIAGDLDQGRFSGGEGTVA